MSTERPVQLIIFDCDGVLIDSEIISARMLIAELAQLGVTIDLPYVTRHFLGRSYPVVMQQIRQDFGLDLPAAFEAAYRERLLAAFEADLRIMPGVAAVLSAVSLPFCIATSSSQRRAERSLGLVGLGHLAGPRLFTAGAVARGKPAPDLFLHAATICGADPAACLVIEDSLNGIRAARAAGMQVWRFTGGSHLAGQGGGEPDDATPDAPPDAPPDATPDRDFDRFADFFTLDPRIRAR